MSTAGISIVALVGWLVLAAWAYRSHRLSGRTMLKQGLIWASIFVAVAAIFTAIGA